MESHILRFEELSEVSDMVITDIVYKMKNEMRAVAVALYKCKDEALLIKFTKNMLPAQGAAFIEESKCLDKITVGEQKGAQFKIIEKARELQNEGIAMIKKYSSRYSSG